METSSNNYIGNPYYTNPVTGVQNNPTGTEGSVQPVFVTPPYGNLVSGNAQHGILCTSSFNTQIFGNFVGTDYAGLSAIPNGLNGAFVANSQFTKFSGCEIPDNPFVYYNIFSGNALHGIELAYSTQTYIQGNFMGIGAQNNNLIPNGGDGLLVGGATSDTVVGGIIPLGNVISGNAKNGIHLSDTATGFETYNTFGGLYAFGGAAPNGLNGILFDGNGTNIRIGKASDSRTNVFSGNIKNGMEIIGQCSDIVVESVIVGLNTYGQYPTIPNQQSGIHIGGDASNITIGNKVNSVIFINVVSGNEGSGILIDENSSDCTVTNTVIGLDVNQTTSTTEPVGNKGDGILINSNNNNVIDVYEANVVAGNGGHGIKVGALFKDNDIINNYVGVNMSGVNYPNQVNPQIDANPNNNKIAGNILPTTS